MLGSFRLVGLLRQGQKSRQSLPRHLVFAQQLDSVTEMMAYIAGGNRKQYRFSNRATIVIGNEHDDGDDICLLTVD